MISVDVAIDVRVPVDTTTEEVLLKVGVPVERIPDVVVFGYKGVPDDEMLVSVPAVPVVEGYEENVKGLDVFVLAPLVTGVTPEEVVVTPVRDEV
jgi:hypothetical protein